MTTIATTGERPLAVHTQKLSKRFGTRDALAGVDLEVPQGTAFGFLGANGAGKTTLIRLLLGLARPTSGEIEVLGYSVPRDIAPALARVGAIIEEPRFHPHLTGRENLHVHASAREREAHNRVAAALARVGLSARADDKVKTYSLGMRQRLGVARCLLCDPSLLILDEPMNGLDPAGIIEFRELIRGLVEEGRTVLLSSHLLDEVEKTCDAAAIVDRGSIVAQGSISELLGAGSNAIDIAVDRRLEAARIAAAMPEVSAAIDCDGGVRVTFTGDARADREIVSELLRRLLANDVLIDRVQPVGTTLEERFLTMTTRLEERV